MFQEATNSCKRATSIMLVAVGALACSSGGTGSGGLVQSGPVTLQDVQLSVFTPRCATSGCHDASGAFGLDLRSGQSYGNLVGVSSAELPAFDRVEPGNALDSYLFMKVTDDARIQGDPMPASGSGLNANQLQMLASWIADGANP